MPHVALVSLSGLRVREPEMLALGMSLPALHDRAHAVAALPALAPITLAAHTPAGWTQSLHEAAAAVLLALFLPEQRRRFEVDRLLRTDPAAGMAYMSRFERNDFPPIWDPPPRLAFGERSPTIAAIHEALLADAAARPWVRALLLDKSWRFLGHTGDLPSVAIDPDELVRWIDRTTAAPEFVDAVRFHADHDERLTPQARDALHRWLTSPPPPPNPSALPLSPAG